MKSETKVLIVEDESIVAIDLKQLLDAQGYEIAGTVASGEDAIAAAESLQPDIVLMDVELRGEVDGIEAARIIRNRLATPVLFLTAYADQQTIQRAIGSAAFGYIVKPVEKRNLQISIEFALEMGRMETALREAKREAEDAARLKAEFVANMSHELRTPLNSIIGMAELSLQLATEREQSEYLRILKTSADGLLFLINNLLDYSKLDAGKMSVQASQLPLHQLASECVESVSVQAREKQLKLDLDIDASVPHRVVGDGVKLRQILLNLLSNAIKFTERGTVKLGVQRLEADDERARLVFTVDDTGIGISDDRLQSVFEPFTQLDGSIKRRENGTGIGLSITSRLVEILEGRITVESAAGQGSRFTVELPFDLPGQEDGARMEGTAAAFDTTTVDGTPAAPETSAAPGTAAAQATPETAYRRDDRAPKQQSTQAAASCEAHGLTNGCFSVLLVEDNRLNRLVNGKLLEQLGHTAREAADGRQALDQLSRYRFDVVLMDVEMPVMDGLEAVRRLRAGEAGPEAAHVPVLALTAHSSAHERRRARDAGMNGFLSKPFSSEALRNALCAAVGRTSQVEQPPSAFEALAAKIEQYAEGGQLVELAELATRARSEAAERAMDEVSDQLLRLVLACRRGDLTRVREQTQLLVPLFAELSDEGTRPDNRGTVAYTEDGVKR